MFEWEETTSCMFGVLNTFEITNRRCGIGSFIQRLEFIGGVQAVVVHLKVLGLWEIVWWIIYFCIKSESQTYWLKTTINVWYLCSFCGSGTREWLCQEVWLMVSCGVCSRELAGTAISKFIWRLKEPGATASKVAYTEWCLLAVGLSSSLPQALPRMYECLCDMVVGFL